MREKGDMFLSLHSYTIRFAPLTSFEEIGDALKAGMFLFPTTGRRVPGVSRARVATLLASTLGPR